MKQICVKLLDLLPVIALAAFGGITRTLAGKARGEPYRLSIAIPEIVLAIFSGLLIHWITVDSPLSDNYRTAAIALAGYSSRSVIALLNAALIRKIKPMETTKNDD